MPLLNFAHRGLSATCPENTMAAFENAALTECDGFETDVRLSKDNEPFLLHDATLERTTNGAGLADRHTFAELRALDAGSWFGKEFTGQKILHLFELLAAAKRHKKRVNLELKNHESNYPGMEQIVISWIKQMDMRHQVLLSSFNHRSMALCKDICPEIQTGLLTAYPIRNAGAYCRALRADALHPNHKLLTWNPMMLSECHNSGIKVTVWTADLLEQMLHMQQKGVDGIITNQPALLAELLHKTG